MPRLPLTLLPSLRFGKPSFSPLAWDEGYRIRSDDCLAILRVDVQFCHRVIDAHPIQYPVDLVERARVNRCVRLAQGRAGYRPTTIEQFLANAQIDNRLILEANQGEIVIEYALGIGSLPAGEQFVGSDQNLAEGKARHRAGCAAPQFFEEEHAAQPAKDTIAICERLNRGDLLHERRVFELEQLNRRNAL